jgi:hypothetical protein
MARTGTKSQDEDFHIQVPADLRVAFEAAAETADRPTTQVIIDLMRDFIDQQQQPEDGYDDWFRAQIRASIEDSRPSIPHDEVMQRTRAIIDDIAMRKRES